MTNLKITLWLTSILLVILPQITARSQIVPDATLPNNSIVTPNGNTLRIDGGTTAGSNLFHSFREFSVPTGNEAFFNNALAIENIITRVTGNNLSNIDGLIRANGGANLFLLNPNGIVFGPNARLEIGGSFLASTANSLLFEDGKFFSATEPNGLPLLTINVPMGLQYGNNNGKIEVQGIGHQIIAQPITLFEQEINFQLQTPFVQTPGVTGLQITPRKTLALIGNDITFRGGTVTAPGGHIELGSVREGFVTIDEDWKFNYDRVTNFGEIELSKLSLADASGFHSGSMQVRGQNLEMSDGSLLLISNFGEMPDSLLNLQVEDFITVSNINIERPIVTAILTQSFGSGAGSAISIKAQNLTIENDALIGTRSYGNGDAGPINVKVDNRIFVGEVSSIPGLSSPTLSTFLLGSGDGQGFRVDAKHIVASHGGSLGAISFSRTPITNGQVYINSETIFLEGFNPFTLTVTNIGNTIAGVVVDNPEITRSGEAEVVGNLLIDASAIRLKDGGHIISDTTGNLNGGNIIINAELIEVFGTVPQGIRSSLIGASAIENDEITQSFGSLPFDVATGDAGSVTINTNQLRLYDEGRVTVEHQGTGNPGSLTINANEILIETEGNINASSNSGEFGNIQLNANNLTLKTGGHITTEARQDGDGGNIAIATNTLTLLDDSRITANAFQGRGGNIAIATQGLFQSPDSAITASSNLGINGTVTISNPEFDSSSVLLQLSDELTDKSDQINIACRDIDKSSFIVTGRGGIPESPLGYISPVAGWEDNRYYSVEDIIEAQASLKPNSSESNLDLEEILNPPQPLKEANSWIRHSDGTIELVALEGQKLWILPDCQLKNNENL